MNNPTNSEQLPSESLIPDNPSSWFDKKFPELSKKHGESIHAEKTKDGKCLVRTFGEDYFAACLGFSGMPEIPTVYLPAENRFYTYCPVEGIFIERREADLGANISLLFLECARACREKADVKRLEFDFRDSASLSGIIKKAKALLAVPADFFSENSQVFIVCNNGVLRLQDKILLPFNTKYQRRNKLNVNFDAAVKCPLFLNTLMRPALAEDDLELLQRWCGLALLGINHAQKLIILSGTAGGGKGTFIRVLQGINILIS